MYCQTHAIPGISALKRQKSISLDVAPDWWQHVVILELAVQFSYQLTWLHAQFFSVQGLKLMFKLGNANGSTVAMRDKSPCQKGATCRCQVPRSMTMTPKAISGVPIFALKMLPGNSCCQTTLSQALSSLFPHAKPYLFFLGFFQWRLDWRFFLFLPQSACHLFPCRRMSER